MKLICYGVRKVEVEFFKRLNKFGYELTLVEELLNDTNIDLIEGHEAVMLRANCPGNRENLMKMKNFGVKYLLTRTVGYNHIDLDAAKELGFKTARVPGYSPSAIAELAVSLAMMLVRRTGYMVSNARNKDFTVNEYMFAPEIRNLTVGIIGTGKIGLTAAKIFKGMGSKVIAYDVYPNESAKDIVEYVSLETLRDQADVISLHCPYFKESNHHFINREFINNMKDGSFIINTARGELQDLDAIIEALESNKLCGYATDVLEKEKDYFFKNLNGKTLDDQMEKLVSLFPKALITPHIGSYTDEALTNMVEISYENLDEYLRTGACGNKLF
ncbi:MAG: 2-hydroxyacid dehydrogenase [Fusobacteriaceae bacterium]